jgi:hypothetical protein
MFRRFGQFALFLGLVLSATLSAPAAADQAAGDACSKNLGPDALLIYRDTSPEVTKNSDIVEMLRSHARALVSAGKIDRDNARAAAQAAGGCLKALRE